MKKVPLIAIVFALAACHRTPQVEPRPMRTLGDFSYRMNVGPTPVAGEFSIAADTVMFEADDHSCRRLPRHLADPPLKHSFSCGGGPTVFTVVVDSKRPAMSRWYSTESVKKQYTVCDRWTTTKEGQRICAASHKEIVTETVGISGALYLTRLAAVDKP